ncbi:glutamate receptor 3 isoform X1 [Apis mellifera caucasica]|nr:glutamate receptor 3 isoform X1 [Apis mellifera caucasica]
MLVLCYDHPVLREWYALRDDKTRVFDLATWKSGQGLNVTTRNTLYARRNNLFGQTMRISIVNESLFIEMKNGVLSLFWGAVVRELSKSMNFKIEVTSIMSEYGSWNEEEKIWEGVIGELASNKSDMGVAEFSMTSHRLDAVDFSLPLIMSHKRIYFKKPDSSSVHWSAYLKTFNIDIWMVIVCLIVSVPIFLTVIKTRGRVKMNVLTDNYMHVWGIYCQQGLSEFPTETSMRLGFLSIFVSSLIILSAYSASLTSFLTVSTVSLPFSTMEEFVDHGSYGLITFRNSADYEIITSNNRSITLKLKKLIKEKHELPLTAQDGFVQVCNEKVGFYLTKAIMNAMTTIPCKTVYIKASGIDSLALILTKRSPYTGLVNYFIQRYKDNGVMNKLKRMYFVKKQFYDTGYNSVTLSGIAPILSVLAGGILFSCLILIFEKAYHQFCSCESKRTYQFVFWQKFFDREIGTKEGRRDQNLAFKFKKNQLSEILRKNDFLT